MGLGKRKYDYTPLPKWKFDVMAGHAVITHRAPDELGEWQSEDTVIEPTEFRAVLDLANLEKGWIAFVSGSGVDFHAVSVRSGKDYSDKPPTPKHREGF